MQRMRIGIGILATAIAVATAGHALGATVINTDDAGTGSLRWAIANTPSGGTVDFANSVYGSTIRLASELRIEATTLTIRAFSPAALAISGEKRCRVLHCTDSNVTLQGLTIENGFDGANGAGILSVGELTMRNCVVRNCVADSRITSGRVALVGGGVHAAGSTGAPLVMDNCTITSNLLIAARDRYETSPRGAGLLAGGGEVIIRNSEFSENVAVMLDSYPACPEGIGTGISQAHGLIENCLFRDNIGISHATAWSETFTGVALSLTYSDMQSSSPTLVRGCRFTGNRFESTVPPRSVCVIGAHHIYAPTILESCVIDHNTVGGLNISASGGGDLSEPIFQMRNTTITGNAAITDTVFADALVRIWTPDGSLCVSHCTIVGNTITGRGDAVDLRAQAYIEGTVISGNDIDTNDTQLSGHFITNGHNVVDSWSNQTTYTLNGPGDMVGVDPMLGPLADNGGHTLTMMPLPGSPLIDAIPSGALFLAYDQRSAPRPEGSGAEIGACELGDYGWARLDNTQAIDIESDEYFWAGIWSFGAGRWTDSLEATTSATLRFALPRSDVSALYLYALDAAAWHDGIVLWHQEWR